MCCIGSVQYKSKYNKKKLVSFHQVLCVECVPVQLRNLDPQESRQKKNRRFGAVDMEEENGEHQVDREDYE